MDSQKNIYERASSLLDLNHIGIPVFQEGKCVIVNGHIIYSRMCEKMKKHCGCAVLIEHNGENFMAVVQYFLYESNSRTVFAVIKRILLDFGNPLLVSEKPHHLLRIAGEEDQHKVVPVDCVLEKNSISFWKSKPHLCITSSKFLWPLSLIYCYTANFVYIY